MKSTIDWTFSKIIVFVWCIFLRSDLNSSKIENIYRYRDAIKSAVSENLSKLHRKSRIFYHFLRVGGNFNFILNIWHSIWFCWFSTIIFVIYSVTATFFNVISKSSRRKNWCIEFLHAQLVIRDIHNFRFSLAYSQPKMNKTQKWAIFGTPLFLRFTQLSSGSHQSNPNAEYLSVSFIIPKSRINRIEPIKNRTISFIPGIRSKFERDAGYTTSE